MTNGSQDSLLSPPENTRSRPVQRAISEPSKKLELLRNQNMHRILHNQPTSMSRAASDNTVQGPSDSTVRGQSDSTARGLKKADSHIYENVSAVRSRLIAAAKAKPNRLSPRVSQNVEFSFFPLAPVPYSKHRLMVKSQGALNNLTQLNFYDQPANRNHRFSSQQNIVSTNCAPNQRTYNIL